MKSDDNRQSSWQVDLADFFAEIEREDQIFSRNVERKLRFYSDVVRPALDSLKKALAHYGRECETGLDHDRVYIIVRKPGGAVEFQYAIVAETKIETITPFAHCWFESQLRVENQAEQRLDENSNTERGSDETAEDEKDEAEEADLKDKNDDSESDKPQRTKTIEMLVAWNDEREIESVTREEISQDFIAHYKEAVGRLRAEMHA